MIDQMLSHFKITAKLGEGGMGEVYRAEDTKLGRDVAIKILPEALTADPERLARFEREAKVLASLNHPNIAGIHQIEKADGRQLLVMELVEGEDLAERMERGALPIEDAVAIATQVAEGLQAAHERGIVHRDLKPANIKLTPDGQVKILDFGLAKAQEATEASPDLTRSPTLTAQMTQAGVILGTAAYMSPEQARGQEADPRSDLWALGVVLWEMLTGRRLFAEPTVSDTLAAVLRAEIELDEPHDDKHPRLGRVLTRCLQRDPKQRYHSAADMRLDLEDALQRRPEPTADGSPATASTVAARRRVPWLASALLVALAVLVGVAIGRFSVPPAIEGAPEPAVARLELPVPSDRPVATGSFLNPLAFSPDGRTLVYIGVEQGTRRLYRRPLDQLVAEPIPGTEGAEGPFFSPDGEEVAFWAQGRVQRVSLAGGLPRLVFTSSDFRGGVWAPDGTIIASPGQDGPLCRVSAGGGKCTPLTADGPGFQHRLPSLLPDGRILFGIRTGEQFAYDNAGLAVLSLESGEVRVVADGVGMDGRYAAGHLFYVQANSLIARPFDLERLEFTGPARTVQQGVQVQSNTGAAQFVLMPDGSLAFLPGEAIGNDIALARVDRDGSSEHLSTGRDVFRWPILTADGSQLTVLIIGEGRGGRWVTRLDQPGLTRMPVADVGAWAPDGRHAVATADDDAGRQELYYVDAFQSGERTTLFTASPEAREVIPTSISPDGRHLLFGVDLAIDNQDVYTVEIEDPSSARPFLDTESIESGARFSPDGRWVAYVSNATGRFEVYVTDWPANRLRRQISTSGGREPLWSPRGDELFYRSGERMMTVRLHFQRSLEVETPQVLFTGDYEGMLGRPDLANYAVAPDGRFLMLRSADLASTADRIALVRNALTRPLQASEPRS